MTSGSSKRSTCLILGILSLIVGLVIGILIGYFSAYYFPKNKGERQEIHIEDEGISERLMSMMDPERIREDFRYLTSKPHVAGTAASREQAEWVRDQWLANGLDKAEIVPYQILLSYPSDVAGEENRVQLVAADGSIEFESQIIEAPLDPDIDTSGILPPYNAYSPSGDIEGELVYANYASVEDFHFLTRDLNIDVVDKIVIARYGRLYRGDKVKNAAKFGAKGIILYSDPADFTVEGEAVYPDGIYLPGTGTQRGSTLSKYGDPLTPGYPAVETAYRRPEENLTTLPAIPVQPIGYNDAKEFLRRMGGDEVQDAWKGTIEGVTYRYGPGFAAPDNDKKVAMRIFTHNKLTDGWNVIGSIRGDVEPDRYVLMGNHRDAWGFGAIDASGGTAVMMEVSKSFGKLLKQGWRPRRTIMFCSWGAEEYGLIGSNEWVEEFSKNLADRSVVYVNLDLAVAGTYIVNIADTPSLSNAIYAATRKVPDPSPSDDRQTIYDTWVKRSRNNKEDGTPVIRTLGATSDYATFVQLLGISAMDFTFLANSGILPYPLYHSVYETFNLVETYYDPGFKYHLAAAQLFGELIRDFSDSVLLPMDCEYYAAAIQEYIQAFKEGNTGMRMLQEGLTLDGLESAANDLTSAAKSLTSRLKNVDELNVLQVRTLNDQMMKLERAFIDPLGLPDRPFIRHVIYAPSSKNVYASDKFAGLADTMFDIDNNPDVNKWEYVKQQLAAVTFAVQSAASTIMDVA